MLSNVRRCESYTPGRRCADMKKKEAPHSLRQRHGAALTLTPTLTLTAANVINVMVVCWASASLLTTVGADECGTRFVDPASSAVRAQAVVMGTVMEWNPSARHERTRSANVSVEKVYKGEGIVNNARAGDDRMIMVSQFGREDKDSCVASDTEMTSEKKHIFFLRQSHHRGMLQMSALPLPMESRAERRVRRSLCDTCVRPPRIKKLVCRDCAQPPKMKDIKPKKVTMGRKVRLRCVAKSQPPPSFSWSKNGIPVTTGNGGITIRTTATSSSLLILKTMSAHAGEYKCIAKNDLGTSEKVAVLELSRRRRKPKYTVQTAPDRVACAGGNLCLNGGTCFHSPSLNLRSCVCPPHYDGVRCELLDESKVPSVHIGPTSAAEAGNSRRSGQPRQGERPRQRQGGVTSTETETEASRQQTARNSAVNNNNVVRENQTSRRRLDSNVSGSAGSERNNRREGSDTESNTVRSTLPAKSTPGSQLSNAPTPTTAAGAPSERSSGGHIDSTRRQKLKTRPSNRKSSVSYNELQHRLRNTHIKIIHCREKRYCHNGGRCRYIPKQKFKFCQCRAGFVGKRCERSLT
ncbi:uncharacterized protein LOC101860157 isoform X2 [Aplysia californica]|uniref:Uncharacterized protein LOC101860157 isoform X2 n=1 Tax=Aplysia californica TaxID=6500 RepID=A0ABM0JJL3_APLCA|nr:uncharacterized protein LOC101860157 isoform X2 [Aplysia californica]